MEIKVNQYTAETVYINHPTASYAIFCFNSVGNLFINSDWGFYGYAWGSYGANFKEFLASLDTDYLIKKLESNYNDVARKKMPTIRKEKLKILLQVFIDQLNKDTL